jgi:hypothetical protein
LNSRPRTFFGLLFRPGAEKSTMAKFVSGKRLATVSIASAMRKPTPRTRSYFCWASDDRFGT